ncbi:MAG: ABC transporter ATP-binding protein, partial [Eubacterium aggregans]
NLLCGSIPVDSGKMVVDGVDITNTPEYKCSTTIGRVYQDPAKGTCASMTILKNMALADNKGKGVGLGLGVDKRRKDFYSSLLTLLGMGLEDKLAVSVGALSGG